MVGVLTGYEPIAKEGSEPRWYCDKLWESRSDGNVELCPTANLTPLQRLNQVRLLDSTCFTADRSP